MAVRRFFLALIILVVTFGLHSSCSQQDERERLRRETEEKEYSILRNNMVEKQIIGRGIQDPRVIEAMRKVPRHLFVPESGKKFAYSDRPLAIGYGQFISRPYIIALMTEALKLEGGEKVLEIGTGSGYQSAIMAEIVEEVYSIEIINELANQAKQRLDELGHENIHIKVADGYHGWKEFALFDDILVTAAPDHIPLPLLEQLKVGGQMIIPVGELFQELILLTKTSEGYQEQRIIPVKFEPMTGEAEKKSEVPPG